MEEKLAQIKEKLQEISEKLSLKQKISIASVVGLMLVIIAGITYSYTKEELSTLFTGLSAEDSAAIVEILRKDKISYDLSQDTSIIRVPEDKVLDIRLRFTAMGLPKGGGVGYEIFDKQDVTTLTEFTERVNMTRALQGELERTISSLTPVKSARVHIVVPKESMFIEDHKDPTSSVLLTMYKGRTLSKRQINSIVHLVSSSIEGLAPDRVTIVDNTGNILSGGDKGLEGLSGKKIAYKRNIEQTLEKEIIKLLKPIVGDGNARVTVNTDIDFDKAERQEEKYDPNITAVRSENKLEESNVQRRRPRDRFCAVERNASYNDFVSSIIAKSDSCFYNIFNLQYFVLCHRDNLLSTLSATLFLPDNSVKHNAGAHFF